MHRYRIVGTTITSRVIGIRHEKSGRQLIRHAVIVRVISVVCSSLLHIQVLSETGADR